MSDAVRADALLAEMPREGRGRLKVFLGAAPGVGKTFAMLQAAQAQLRQGVDLRAGVVETHGRAETEALLVGVPQQPQRSLMYRDVAMTEMDLDGILAKPPKLLLVDELAHTNAPGSRHSKRFDTVYIGWNYRRSVRSVILCRPMLSRRRWSMGAALPFSSIFTYTTWVEQTISSRSLSKSKRLASTRTPKEVVPMFSTLA